MRETRVWGDGFADDSWRELILVRDWTLVSSDEYVRLFPALVPADRKVPEPIRAFVLGRASEIEALQKQKSDAARVASDGRRALFLGDAAPGRASAGTHRHGPGFLSMADDQGESAFLRKVVRDAPQAAMEGVCERDMARFAFLTGVHPAYIWPAAAVLAYWGTALAWLGALSRCGFALMPEEVAEYFGDELILASNGAARVRNSLLADFVHQTLDPGQLLRAVRQRKRGARVVLRHRPARMRENQNAPRPLSRALGYLRLALWH
jgi:hypothetical protein